MMNRDAKLKRYAPYVKGIVGADFKLTLKQRFHILFCKKLSVIFANESFQKKAGENK